MLGSICNRKQVRYHQCNMLHIYWMIYYTIVMVKLWILSNIHKTCIVLRNTWKNTNYNYTISLNTSHNRKSMMNSVQIKATTYHLSYQFQLWNLNVRVWNHFIVSLNFGFELYFTFPHSHIHIICGKVLASP